MDSIRFNASNQTFRPEVLNHRTSSPFQQNQIQFHIGSSYLTDFTDKGIENFVANQPGGKDLNPAEVKLFIQRVAQNAGDAKNITFDLNDAQLGLRKDDGIESRHLSGAFTLNMSDKAVLPEGQARNIRFVDVTSGSFDLKVKEDKVKTLGTELESAKEKLSGLKDKLDDARRDLATTREILGPDAQVRLDRTLNRKEAIKQELAQLGRDEADYQQMLTSPDITPERKRSLERAIASLPAEKKSLEDENRKLDETLADKSGPLLQRRSLNDLQAQMRAVDALGTEHRQFQGKVEQLETGLAAARKAEVTPAGPAPAVPPADAAAATQTGGSDAVNVGPAVDLEELRKLPPNHQATRLASLPAEQQKAAVAQLKPEERQAIQQAADGFIANLSRSQSTRVSQSRQLESYKTLQTSLAQVAAQPPTAQPPAAAPGSATVAQPPAGPAAEAAQPAPPAGPAAQTPAAQTPAAPATTPSAPAAVAEQPAPAAQPAAPVAPAQPAQATDKPAPAASEISLGAPGQTLPADALTRFGRPLMHQNKVLTMSQFSSLNMQAKFDVLMTCDEEFMVKLLATHKDLRSQFRAMSQKVVNDFKVSQQTARPDTNTTVVHNSNGSSSVVMNVNGEKVNINVSTTQYRDEASATRAQLIINVIDELNALDTQGRSSEYDKVKIVRGQVVKVSQGQYAYDVKPRDTASSIARDKAGSEFKNYDVFTHNPGLEPAMRARHNNGDFNRYEEDISAYEEYKQLILSTQASPPPINQPAARSSAAPAPAPATNPTVTVAPPAAPKARTQPAPAAQPAASATPAKSTPAAAPTPAAAETAPLVVEEAPAAPAQPAAPTPVKAEPVAAKPAEPVTPPAEPAKPAAQPVVPATPERKPAPKNQRTS